MRTDTTPFGSLRLAADVRSDRDEVAPRTLSYRPTLSESDRHLQGAAADGAGHATAQRLRARLRQRRSDRDDPATILAQKKSVLDYVRGRSGPDADPHPASEKDRLAAHATAITQLESSLRQTYG